MDTTARRRKIQKLSGDALQEIYNHDINMYTESPGRQISLSEFEDLALERLQLLRIIEQATLKGNKPFTEDWKHAIKEDLSKSHLKKYHRLLSGYCGQTEQDYQARRADHISHFILRLAYCRSEDLRRWFISREMEWFRLRFSVQSQKGIMKFLELNNLTYVAISNEEKEDIRNQLIMSTPSITDVSCDTNDFYKVLFTEVYPLVKSRKVFLHRGYAYVPTCDLIICVQSKFRTNLSEALNVCNHRLPSMDDDRLNSLLSNLHHAYTGRDYTVQSDKEGIDATLLDTYSKQHFPICMRHVHDILKSTHHLKHHCRLQYGLFLKGIGLLYDDAMEFWRNEFTKVMDLDKFERQYSYNVKHLYGKAGNQTNYSPYSCIKIILNNVGPGEHHGCPFKHWDPAVVKQKMVEYGISSEGVHTVLELVTNGHYQVACTKYFEYTHAQQPPTVISHPNQYFVESMNLIKDKPTVKN